MGYGICQSHHMGCCLAVWSDVGMDKCRYMRQENGVKCTEALQGSFSRMAHPVQTQRQSPCIYIYILLRVARERERAREKRQEEKERACTGNWMLRMKYGVFVYVCLYVREKILYNIFRSQFFFFSLFLFQIFQCSLILCFYLSSFSHRFAFSYSINSSPPPLPPSSPSTSPPSYLLVPFKNILQVEFCDFIQSYAYISYLFGIKFKKNLS